MSYRIGDILQFTEYFINYISIEMRQPAPTTKICKVVKMDGTRAITENSKFNCFSPGSPYVRIIGRIIQVGDRVQWEHPEYGIVLGTVRKKRLLSIDVVFEDSNPSNPASISTFTPDGLQDLRFEGTDIIPILREDSVDTSDPVWNVDFGKNDVEGYLRDNRGHADPIKTEPASNLTLDVLATALFRADSRVIRHIRSQLDIAELEPANPARMSAALDKAVARASRGAEPEASWMNDARQYAHQVRYELSRRGL